MQFNLTPPVVYVDTDAQFAQCADDWTHADYLAIDTEFERRTTYYPILALVQIFDGQTIYLIDPLKVNCPAQLVKIFADKNIVKIMHSCKEDLEVLYHSWRCKLVNLFDTQVAYAFTAGSVSIGYAALVNLLCNVSLAKEATQSNWRLRPLSETQLDYAAKDVLYLPSIYSKLCADLEAAQLVQLHADECLEMCEHVNNLPNFQTDFRQAGDVWRLDENQIVLFKHLYQWREETAIAEDKTRNHIMKDHLLVQVAQLQPESKHQLQKINELHPKSIRLYADQILKVVAEYTQASADPIKPVANPRDLPQLNLMTDKFLTIVAQQAKKIGLSASILVSKRLAKKIAFSYITKEPFPSAWQGWRKALLAPLFDDIYAQIIK